MAAATSILLVGSVIVGCAGDVDASEGAGRPEHGAEVDSGSSADSGGTSAANGDASGGEGRGTSGKDAASGKKGSASGEKNGGESDASDNSGGPAALPKTLDYSSPADLAVSVSYPLYKGGRKADPRAFTGGGPVDAEMASENYKKLKKDAYEIAKKAGSELPPWPDESYANCSAFTGAVVIATIDPEFPGNLVRDQREYMSDPFSGWRKVGDSSDYRQEDLLPGDLFLTPKGTRLAHTWMWIGEHDGVENVVAQAAYGSEGNSGARLPSLQIDPLQNSDDGTDGMGRSYEIWRYVGNAASV
ncbi:hypothetical protein [Leucobacter tenebrionis]|uniref:hypothetical protein n=1 Tax=Leucobacter tenebrionis TaxID=2873270 RepID=UPI001CA73F4E|nr:hypothetical protein [Leucobacter tenebrionis]QZY53123.1 hypothetical protein KVY00_06790 [Leucobacter tenebrionis]